MCTLYEHEEKTSQHIIYALCRLEMEYNNITYVRYYYNVCKNTHGRDGCCNGDNKYFFKKNMFDTRSRDF